MFFNEDRFKLQTLEVVVKLQELNIKILSNIVDMKDSRIANLQKEIIKLESKKLKVKQK